MLGKIRNGFLENNYKPHWGQRLIHNAKARFRICVCGRRFGKTVLALNELYKQAYLNRDKLARCWYIAPNYRQAKTVAWEMLKETIPDQMISAVNEAELSVRLMNGSMIELKGADSQDSLRGAKLKFAVLDEYATMRPTVWDEVIRPAMVDSRDSRAMFIGTPSGFNHFKVLFDKGNSGDPEYKSFRFSTVDNPYIPKKEIEEIRKKTNAVIFRQEYEASFEQMSGSIYPMFKRDTHVIKAMELDGEWDRVVAMDWGSRNATAILFAAIDPQGVIYVYDCLYGNGRTVSQWAEIIKCRADYEDIKSWVIDPSALAQAREFGQYGIYFHSYNPDTNRRINDVTIGINLVSQYFLENKLRIFSHCESLIREIEQYQWEPTTSRLGADSRPKPLKRDDHSVDACFPKNTMISTEFGEKRIVDMKVGEMVWTRQGLKPVEAVFYTGERKTVEVDFENGNQLIGTGNHPLWVDGIGFKPLSDLRYGDMSVTCIQTNTEELQGGFGKRFLVKFQKAITSITETAIRRITNFQILNVSMLQRIFRNTGKIIQESLESAILAKSFLMGYPGMELGSVPMLANLWRGDLKGLMSNPGDANVERRSSVIDSLKQNIVQDNVLESVNINEKSSYPHAKIATNHSRQNRSTPSIVPIAVRSVSEGRILPVYNLTVSDAHEYFANGRLVSNCRYLVMTRPKGHTAKKEKYKGLDGASEMFWRSHFKDMPKEVDYLYPRDTILAGIDEGYGTDYLGDLWG